MDAKRECYTTLWYDACPYVRNGHDAKWEYYATRLWGLHKGGYSGVFLSCDPLWPQWNAVPFAENMADTKWECFATMLLCLVRLLQNAQNTVQMGNWDV